MMSDEKKAYRVKNVIKAVFRNNFIIFLSNMRGIILDRR